MKMEIRNDNQEKTVKKVTKAIGKGIVNKDALKVRLNPDMDAPILCLLPLNNEVYVDRKFVRDGNEWMHILGPEIYLNKGASLCGYVKAEFLDFTECEINPTE